MGAAGGFCDDARAEAAMSVVAGGGGGGGGAGVVALNDEGPGTLTSAPGSGRA